MNLWNSLSPEAKEIAIKETEKWLAKVKGTPEKKCYHQYEYPLISALDKCPFECESNKKDKKLQDILRNKIYKHGPEHPLFWSQVSDTAKEEFVKLLDELCPANRMVTLVDRDKLKAKIRDM